MSGSVRMSGDELHHVATGSDVIKLNGLNEWIEKNKLNVYIADDCDRRGQSRDAFHQVGEFVEEQLISRR